jgi:hypothetical protein
MKGGHIVERGTHAELMAAGESLRRRRQEGLPDLEENGEDFGGVGK